MYSITILEINLLKVKKKKNGYAVSNWMELRDVLNDILDF